MIDDRIFPTGIVRKLDEIGRIVIPAELRTALGWEAGRPVEFYTDRQGNIILRRYSALAGVGGTGELAVRTIHKTINCRCMLTDRDTILVVAGYPANMVGQLPPKYVSKAMETIKTTTAAEGMAVPILRNGDVVGALAASSYGDIDIEPLLKVMANFLASYLSF